MFKIKVQVGSVDCESLNPVNIRMSDISDNNDDTNLWRGERETVKDSSGAALVICDHSACLMNIKKSN